MLPDVPSARTVRSLRPGRTAVVFRAEQRVSRRGLPLARTSDSEWGVEFCLAGQQEQRRLFASYSPVRTSIGALLWIPVDSGGLSAAVR